MDRSLPKAGKSACILLFFLSFIMPVSMAGEWQIAAGIADEVDGDSAPVATVGYIVQRRFPVEVVVGRIGERTVRSGTIEPSWFAGTNLRWHGSWWFVGGGVAWVNHESEILSSRYQFLTSAGLRWNDAVLTLRHLSNASTGGRNRGETMLTLGWAW